MIHLKIKDVLVAARKAFDAGELQMQKDPNGACQYAGPCAVGIALKPATRKRFDAQPLTGVSSLIRARLLDCDDAEALKELQYAHDSGRPERFGSFLSELEARYGLDPSHPLPSPAGGDRT